MSDLLLAVGEAGEVLRVPGGTHVWLGSDPGAYVRIEGPDVSPLHALVSNDAGLPTLLAVEGSSIVVNGEEKPLAVLHDGDRIAVGGTEVRVRLEAGDEPPEEPEEARREGVPFVAFVIPPPRTDPIPAVLHSAYENGPFRTCTDCGKPLLVPRAGYERLYCAAKIFRDRECIFEVALCHICSESLKKRFSEESKRVLEAEAARGRSGGLVSCGRCGQPASALGAYGISYVCHGSGVIQASLELLCDRCDQDVESRLSRKTRDGWGEWVDTHIPGIPAGLDLSPISI